MRGAYLGVSVSLSEGFNLPLAEMQWLDRSCRVLDAGEHQEVVVDRCYLCRDLQEMTEKAVAVLNGRGASESRTPAVRRFRERFTWNRAVKEYEEIFEQLTYEDHQPVTSKAVSIIIDVTHSTKDPSNSGINRVTRRTSRLLQGYEDLLFVVWDGKHKHYVLPTPQEFDQLSAFNGPIPVSEDRLSADFDNRSDLDEALDRFGRSDPCLLLPEIRSEEEYRGIRRYARVRELGIGAIFYDAIAILHPNLCSKEIELNHGAYMRGLAECDVVVPISHFSANCLTEYWKSCDVQPTRVIVSALPGEFAPSERKLKPIAPPNGTVEILCVSTLEPRKNHRVLIEACLRLQERNPDVSRLSWKWRTAFRR